MAYNTPALVVTGDLYPASQHNTGSVNNLIALAPSTLSISSTGTQTALPTPSSVTNGLLIITNPSLLTIQGIQAGRDGQLLAILAGNAQINIVNYSSGATVANRIIFSNSGINSGILSLVASGMVLLQYNATSLVWRMVSHLQGGSISYTPTYAGVNAMTVASSSVIQYIYRNRMLRLDFDIVATVGGTPDTAIEVTLPTGYVAAGATYGDYNRSGVGGCLMQSLAGNNTLFMFSDSTGAAAVWPAGASRMIGSFELEVQ